MPLDWDDIRYFVAAARGGSTLAASRVLDVSQTTVARRIDRIEQRIALRLFERHSGGYRLTAAGAQALEDAEAVVWEVEDFLGLFPAGRRPLAGKLRIITEEPLARTLVMPAVDAIRLEMPLVQWEMVVRDARADPGPPDIHVGVSLAAPAPRAGVSIRALKGAIAWAVFARRASVGAERRAFAGDDEPPPLRLLSCPPGICESVRPEGRYLAGLAALVAATRRGEGAAVLPALLGDSDPELVRAPMNAPFPRRTNLWLSYPERRVQKAVIDRLADALLARAGATLARAGAATTSPRAPQAPLLVASAA